MDEGTYWARVHRLFSMMDIRTAFVTDASVDNAVELLKAHEEGKATEVSSSELQMARKIKDSVVHPDTGEKIFLPLRLSFIIPCNLILDTLMLSARGFMQNVGAQWLNQTYNCLHYYANRNASNEESLAKIFEAYVGATASSVGTVLGLHALVDKVPRSKSWRPIARRVVPFCGVAAADFLNLGITRRNEILDGIKVMDSNGEEIGHSRTAGIRAVGACIMGRIAAAAPILVVPPLVMHRLCLPIGTFHHIQVSKLPWDEEKLFGNCDVERSNWRIILFELYILGVMMTPAWYLGMILFMSRLERTRIYTQRPYLKVPTLMTMIAGSIQVCVPLCIGVFHQHASIDVRKLEPQFHDRVDKFGRPIRTVFYNKGI